MLIKYYQNCFLWHKLIISSRRSRPFHNIKSRKYGQKNLLIRKIHKTHLRILIPTFSCPPTAKPASSQLKMTVKLLHLYANSAFVYFTQRRSLLTKGQPWTGGVCFLLSAGAKKQQYSTIQFPLIMV